MILNVRKGPVNERKNVVVVDLPGFCRVEADLGPLVPVSVVAKLLGCARRRVYRWIERGSVPVVRVWGQAFLPVRDCHRLCSVGRGVGHRNVGSTAVIKPPVSKGSLDE